jgi:hypothetical protein
MRTQSGIKQADCTGQLQIVTFIPRSRASGVSRDRPWAPWFETREDALLTMRG